MLYFDDNLILYPLVVCTCTCTSLLAYLCYNTAFKILVYYFLPSYQTSLLCVRTDVFGYSHTHTPYTQISFANSKEFRSPDPNPSQLPTLLFFLSFESINHDTAHKASNHTHTPNRFSFLLILFLILFSLFEGVHPSPYIKRDHRSVQEDYSRIQPRARLY